MNCWDFLGIEPTADKRLIKRAYANKLRSCNPEDDQEGFIALRQAYEQALLASKYVGASDDDDELNVVIGNAFADVFGERPAHDVEPSKHEQEPSFNADEALQRIQERLRLNYSDFPERIKLESWQAILADDACWNLEVKRTLTTWLFGFIYEHKHVPFDVYQYLESEFNWLESYDQLSRKFPLEQIDAVCSRIKSPASLALQNIVFDQAMTLDEIEWYLDQRLAAYYLMQYDEIEKAQEILSSLPQDRVQDFELMHLIAQFCLQANQMEPYRYLVKQIIEAFPTIIDGHLMLAKDHFDQGNYLDALNSYKQALAIDRYHVRAIKGVAASLFSMKYYDEALEMYQKIQAMYDYDMEAAARIVDIHQAKIKSGVMALENIQSKGVYDSIQQEDYERYLRQVVEGYLTFEDVDRCHFVLTEAESFLSDKNFEHQTNSRFNPSFQEFNVYFARVLKRLNHTDRAMHYYQKALECATDQGENPLQTLYDLGNFLYELTRYEESLQYLQKSLEITQSNANIYLAYSQSLRFCGNSAQALLAVNRAIELEPGLILAYWERSYILFQFERFQEAIADFETYLSQYDDVWCQYRLGICYEKIGNYQQAISYFTDAINYDSRLMYPYQSLIELALHCGLIPLAIQTLEKYRQLAEADASLISAWQGQIEVAHKALNVGESNNE